MLELDDLRRSYGGTVALDGISFTVGDGQMFGFVGPNGAGKTTAMRIVLGVLAPDGGAVRWQGRPIAAEDRRRFGYMPEERGLYPKMRVRDQLVYFARLHGLEAGAAAQAADGWLERVGLGDRAGDGLDELSLGNQQRVQLAASLVHDPVALVLDEPFSGLDPVAVDVMGDVLAERCAAGVPVLFSSHQLELVERLCQAVAIIKGGRIVATGPVEQLRRDAAGEERLRVDVAGSGGAWAARTLDGRVHVREIDGDRVILGLAPGTTPDSVLDAARAAGTVTHFGHHEPSLAELFRSAVTDPGEEVAA